MQEMPYDPNYVWSSFLSSCKMYGYAELGREAADQLIKMEPYKQFHTFAVMMLLINNKMKSKES